MNYAQIRDKVDQTVKDTAGKLTSDERDRWIQEAVKIYSKHRPRTVTKDVTGDGTYDYSISAKLPEWLNDFSIIKSIEYPADQRDPVYLEEEDFMVLDKEAGQCLRFLNDTPQATEKFRVAHTALHIVSESQNTIPVIDGDALCDLAASLCSQALASIYAGTSDSTIGADSVNYRTKSQEFTSRAKEQKKLYLEHLGIKEGEVVPASAVKDMSMNYPGGDDRLTHSRRQRQKR